MVLSCVNHYSLHIIIPYSPVAPVHLGHDLQLQLERLVVGEGAAKKLPPTVQQAEHHLAQRGELVGLAGHEQALPDLSPFAQHLRALGDHGVGPGHLLQVHVRLGEEADGARLAQVHAAEPVAALLQDLHRVAHVQRQTVAHLAMPVVDR